MLSGYAARQLWGGHEAARAQTNDDWKLEKNKDQIQVYSRRLPNSKLSELKIECTMPGTQSQLVALLSDINNYENVIYKMKSAKLVKRISETELIYYGVSDFTLAGERPGNDCSANVQLCSCFQNTVHKRSRYPQFDCASIRAGTYYRLAGQLAGASGNQ